MLKNSLLGAGGCRAGRILPALLVAVTIVCAAPAAAALLEPTHCQVDLNGANDQPGQKDLTQFCVDIGTGIPFELHTSASMDLIGLSGGNTADFCVLFDSDSDGNVNLAVCTTLSSSPAALSRVRLFGCSDTASNKCAGSTQLNVCTGGATCLNSAECPLGETCAQAFDTACEVSQKPTDPFPTGDSFPQDSVAVCAIDLNEFGVAGATARIVDACSYPSTIPNSDPSDCVLYTECTTASQCNDGNACTTDTCQSSVCVHTPNTGAACDDGDICTSATTCNNQGFCTNGTAASCNDNNPCTTDTCNPPVGCTYTPVSNSTPCDDGQYCTTGDVCTGGLCGGASRDCSDAIACTADSCNEATDTCLHAANNASCSNGQYCDGAEVCNPASGCESGTPVQCSDGIACTSDSCNEATDQCVHVGNDAACNDGQFCNGVEACSVSQGCVAGTPVSCSDAIGCTADSCNEVLDQCEHAPNNGACSNGQYCDGAEVCNPAAGCQAGAPILCNDGIFCTADSCDEATDQCEHAPNNGACSNGEYCDGAEVCNPAAGCQAGAPILCSDGISCTLDTCNETTDRCDHLGDDAACDDQQFCNGVETCNVLEGCLAGTPVDCSDAVACTTDFCDETADQCTHAADHGACDNGLFCDGTEICDLAAGCEAGPATDCGDGVGCTVDTCNEAADRCDHSPNNAACSNAQFCDGSETCDPVSDCQPGTPPSCDDGVSCTADACNETTDQCDHAPDDGSCSNGQYCDGVETCDSVDDCQAGTPPSCDDGVSCTADSCDESADTCDHVPNDAACTNPLYCDGTETCDPVEDCQAGTNPCLPLSCSETLDRCVACITDTQCNNGQYCDGVELCDESTGTCVRGTPVVCNDGIACTTDACDEATDACANTPDSAACSNGLYCDGTEICNPSSGCQAGTPVACADTVACTRDTCDEALRRCTFVPDNTLCSDGQFCNGVETCGATTGCRAGTPLTCSDGVPCTLDSCNESIDACVHTPNDALCSDGRYCSGAEFCDPVQGCRTSPPIGCSDGIACTTDSCDEIADACRHVPNHSLCTNGLYCDGGEVCDTASGCGPGAPVDCNDGNACTADSCQESSDMCLLQDICCGNGATDIGEECDDGNLADADGCDSNCKYTRCGNGVVTPGEECEYTEVCDNLVDDDDDGLFDCADPDCRVENCSATCRVAPPCTCIEEDPAIVLLSKTPNFFRVHGRVPGDSFTIDPQGDGVTLQLSNANGVIYQAILPPNSFVARSNARFTFKDKTAVTGVDPAGPHAGLALLSMVFREIEGVSYMTFKVKAYGDFSLATLPCMTTQLTTGDTVAALRTDWTLRKAGAWWLRPGDYVCPSSCDEDTP